MNDKIQIHPLVFPFLLLLLSSWACNNSGANNNRSQFTETSDIQSVQFNIPASHQVGGFALGTQAYTFNRYSVFEAIEKTAKAGGRVIELYPGQKLRPDSDQKLTPEVSDKVIKQVKQKLDEHNLLVVNFGVINLPADEERIRQIFDFAEKLRVKAITSEPSPEAMDLIEEMVREYAIAVAIHNHPPREDHPDYKHWDPEFVRSLYEGRDRRIGVCADIGHYVRSDIKPTEALRLHEGRLLSLHFTDVDQYGAEGEDAVAGTGVIDLPAVLTELKRQDFGGHISIEYENNWLENVTDVAQFVGYVRGWSHTLRSTGEEKSL